MASSSTPSQPVAAIMEDTPKTARAPADPVVPETQETATPAPAAPIEAETFDAADSAFGDDEGSILNYGSATSSIYNFRQENGRTYHAYSDGKYLLPNDEKEQDRLDMAYHAIYRMFNGKPFFAPVKNPQRIVDMGTGTGIWALDVGDQYPEAHVIGIDLSPIQPKWTAPNVEFRIDDIDQPWVFDSPLDLIHSRVCQGIAIRDWSKYLTEAYKALRPGGWVETQECNLLLQTDDNSLPPNSKIVQWHDQIREGMLLAGQNLRQSSQDIKQFMEDAGFVNVAVVDMKMPISPWPKDKRLKEAGGFMMLSIMEDLAGLSLAVFTRLLGWERIELDLFLTEVKKEWKRKDIHAYWPLFAVYGQKPFDAGT